MGRLGLVGGSWADRVVEVVWLACMVRLVRLDKVVRLVWAVTVRLVRVFWVVRLVRLAG